MQGVPPAFHNRVLLAGAQAIASSLSCSGGYCRLAQGALMRTIAKQSTAKAARKSVGTFRYTTALARTALLGSMELQGCRS